MEMMGERPVAKQSVCRGDAGPVHRVDEDQSSNQRVKPNSWAALATVGFNVGNIQQR